MMEITLRIDEVVFHQILFGGDQFIVAQAICSTAICSDHVLSVCTRRDHLEGLLPVVKDWHVEQCLLKVIGTQGLSVLSI